jgi:hypothetical protein
MSTIRGNSSFHVGDRVRFDLGRRKLTGVVVEDRGAIGVGGRRLFQVEVPTDPFEPMMMEMPEDELELVPPGSEKVTPLDKGKVIEYLVNGGLISILHSNIAGGKNQPRVWLRPDNLGNITYTFVPERGVIGGQVVPDRAVRAFKVFTPRRDAVVSFVESFGLNHREAERVVAEVGTAP